MKKVLSILLAVVLLFGAVPFSASIKSALGVSQASAMETVTGSFDYVVNYVKKYGNNNEIEDHYKYNSDSVYVSIEYDTSNDCLFCFYNLFVSSNGVYSSMMLRITRTGKTYTSVVGSLASTLSIEERATTNISPQSFSVGQSYTYSYVNKPLTNSQEYITVLENLFDYTIDAGVVVIDEFLTRTVSFGLGNFGFVNVSSPAPVPGTASTVSFWDSIVNFFKMIIDFFRNLFSAVAAA